MIDQKPNDWPGKYEGVRPPLQDETPLSWEEVRHGQQRGDLCPVNTKSN